MTQALDIVASTVIGGIMLLIILQLNSNMVQTASVQTMNTSTQENMTTFAALLENDFNKLGFRVTDSLKVSAADTSRIVFKGDFRNIGTIDSVSYALNASLDNSTTNPRDRLVYRTYNNQTPQAIRFGITRFKLWYYDSLGQETSARSRIKVIRVAVNLESMEPFDKLYTGASLERTFKPRNLR